MNFARINSLASITPGMKVLLANMPMDGHFNPLTGIAKYLLEIGCDVRWYSSERYAHKIEKLGIPHYPFVKALDVNSDNINQLFPERTQVKGMVKRLNLDMKNIFILRAPEQYQDILEIRKTFDFDVLVAEITFTGLCFIREKLNKPVVGISIFPLIQSSKDLPPYGLAMTPSKSLLGRYRQSLLRYIANRILFGKSNKLMQQILGQEGIKTTSKAIFDIIIEKADLVLQSGTPGFEYHRSDLAKNVHFVGPLLSYAPPRKGGAWYHPKLKEYKKIILVTQGTVEKDANKIIVPVLEAFKNTKYLVIATTGGSHTQDLRKKYPHPNLIIEDYIPFEDVLPHADVYISNGGYGGVLLSITHSVPMVVAGVHEGKNEINARIGYFKLGINLGKENPTAVELSNAVEIVMKNPSYWANVNKLSKEFAQYQPNKLVASHIAALVPENSQYKSLVTEADSRIY